VRTPTGLSRSWQCNSSIARHFITPWCRRGSNPANELLFETRRGFCEPYASSFPVLMLVALSLTLGILMLGSIRERRPLDPLEAEYRRFCQRLARVGLARLPSEGPMDFGRRIVAQRPDLAANGRSLSRALYPGAVWTGGA
jgi:hypothetical protein